MRVLVACVFSCVVRDAFRARGHDAVSCDLLPSERPGPHIVGDAAMSSATAGPADRASALKDLANPRAERTTLPGLTVMSSFVTSATRRSRSEPAAVFTTSAGPPAHLARQPDDLDDLVDALCHHSLR